MRSGAATSFVIAIAAGVLGFIGIAGAPASVAQVLFCLFLVVFLVMLIRERRSCENQAQSDPHSSFNFELSGR